VYRRREGARRRPGATALASATRWIVDRRAATATRPLPTKNSRLPTSSSQVHLVVTRGRTDHFEISPAKPSIIPPRIGERSIVMPMSVCLFVCDHVSGSTRPIFTKFLRMLPIIVVRSCSGYNWTNILFLTTFIRQPSQYTAYKNSKRTKINTNIV